MEFENNEKKHEEPTQQDGFQREVRQGRSPRPRIHTAQRPTIPLSVVAIVLVTTTRVAMVSSVRAVMASVLKVATVSSVRAVMASVLRVVMVSSVRAVTANVLRAATVSSVRAVMVSVLRVATVSNVRAVTTSVLSRAVMANPTEQRLTRRQHTADYDPNAKYSLKKRIEYKEINYDPNEPLRLNKFLANAGICSRREADEFIQAGVVTVNGEVVTELGTKILRTDEVKFHDQPVKIEKKVYVLLNKPKDYVTTSDDPQQRKTVMDLVKNACPERIYPVGRLDRNTTGVLLLTNDGDLASKLTHPKYLKKKIYHVYLDKNVTAHDLQQIAEGIQLEDGEIKADDVQYAHPTDKKQVGIEIHSGKNRIVRRIFESLGYHVQKLDRVQFAGLTKKNLKRGDWRYLTEEEVDRLRMGAYE